MARVLVVDDEQKLVMLLKSALEHQGHAVTGVNDGRAALELVAADFFDVVLTDLRMEPVDGMQVIAGVKEASPRTEVVVLTAYGEVKTAVAALRAGAYQYLTKPFNFNEVAHVVAQAARQKELTGENAALKQAVAAMGSGRKLIGDRFRS